MPFWRKSASPKPWELLTSKITGYIAAVNSQQQQKGQAGQHELISAEQIDVKKAADSQAEARSPEPQDVESSAALIAARQELGAGQAGVCLKTQLVSAGQPEKSFMMLAAGADS